MSRQKAHPSYKPTRKSINSQLASVAKNLQNVLNKMEEYAKESVEDIGQKLAEESGKICPVDEGDLKQSLYLVSAIEGGKYVVEVGYTDPKAVFAHEIFGGPNNTYLNPTTPGTFPKFLETPLAQIEGEIVKKVADKVKEVIT